MIEVKLFTAVSISSDFKLIFRLIVSVIKAISIFFSCKVDKSSFFWSYKLFVIHKRMKKERLSNLLAFFDINGFRTVVRIMKRGLIRNLKSFKKSMNILLVS